MIPYKELSDKVDQTSKVWVMLYDGLTICLHTTAKDNKFIGKLVPCAKNSRDYIVDYTDIKEYTKGWKEK